MRGGSVRAALVAGWVAVGSVGPARAAPPAWTADVAPLGSTVAHASGVAVQRRGAGPCDVAVAVAFGSDLDVGGFGAVDLASDPDAGGCRVAGAWRALGELGRSFGADVVAADLDGDGRDEVVGASLAELEPGCGKGRIGTGRVLLFDADGAPVQTLLDGVSAAALAVGDVDGDGLLDVVVGTYGRPRGTDVATLPVGACVASGKGPPSKHPAEEGWSPLAPALPSGDPPPEGACPSADEDIQRLTLSMATGGPTYVLRQVTSSPLAFEAFALDVRAATDLELADVDGDGHVDLVAAASPPTIVYGPLVAGPVACLRLAWGEGASAAILAGLDVDVRRSEGGSTSLLTTAGPFDQATLQANPDASGLQAWRLDGRAATPAPFLRMGGFVLGLRAVDLDGVGAPEALVGRLAWPLAPSDPPCRYPYVAGWCLGDEPWLVPGGADGVAGLAPAHVALRGPADGPVLPMIHVIEPYTTGLPSHVVAARAPGRCGEGWRVVTWSRGGMVAGVDAVVDAHGAPVPFRHVPGDAQVYVAAHGAVRVDWRIADAPAFVLASVSPGAVGTPPGGVMIVRDVRQQSTTQEGP